MSRTKNSPKVSILCITYNHINFIRQTLDGFLMQRTNFAFEILIHDDASTDGTTEIIQEYAQKYPDIVKPIYEVNNQYSTGKFDFIWDMYKAARGQYIATCEGDDYWIDENKLQLQTEYLDKNRDCTVCFHPVRVVSENSYEEYSIFPESNNAEDFTIVNLLKSNYIQTNSVMYRKKSHYDDVFIKAMPGDWYTHLYHAAAGKIGFIDKTMSAYRRHEGGVWWGAKDKKDDFWISYGISHLRTYDEIRKIYNDQYIDAIYESVSRIYDALFELKSTTRTDKIILDSMQYFPELITGAYASYRTRLSDLQIYARKQENDVMKLHRVISTKDEYIHDLEDQIKRIYDTKWWRIMMRISHYAQKMRIKK